MALTPEDEYLHTPPAGVEGLWSDNFWFSVVDREADVLGINHIHASLSHGYLRASAFYVVDGLHQQWASRQPLDPEPHFKTLGDGKLTYEVIEPFKHVRWQMDGPKFGFDVDFHARFDPFDYDDCIGGNPLAAFEHYGGHFEQAYHATGVFEARGGPRAGEQRRIDSWSHRDHSWTHRFTHPSPWEPRWKKSLEYSLGHFWPSVQLPDRHLNAFGWLSPGHPIPPGAPRSGGWIADAGGARPIRSATGEARFEDDYRTAMSFRLTFELLDGETLTVLTGRKLGHTRNGLMRDENDAEVRLDCHEPFFEFEVLETGERGYGVVEYSMEPAWPRYRF
jgi:hypothetical protein